MFYFFMWSGLHKPKGDWVVAIHCSEDQVAHWFDDTGYSYDAVLEANSKEEAKELYHQLRCM